MSGLHNLDLDAVGPIGTIVTCTVEGILEAEDLASLLGGGQEAGDEHAPMPSAAIQELDDPGNLKKIKEKHHSVARLLAQGLQQELVATITGYTAPYLSVLLNNPAMKELIEMYRLQHGSAAQVIGERLRTVGGRALEKLSDKIDSIEDVNELIGIAKLGLDRSGHGPQSTSKVVEEHHLIDHARIQELNQKARAGSRELLIPLEQAKQRVLEAPKDA
jgi:hypothetical protein